MVSVHSKKVILDLHLYRTTDLILGINLRLKTLLTMLYSESHFLALLVSFPQINTY